jgi:gliding motility-associated lipoprotein GldK
MKKLILLTIIVALFTSCGSKNSGELIEARGKKWHPEKPYGMSLVPGGSFTMGKTDEDRPALQDAPAKTVTVRAFYMDETEITNGEYRSFVEWTRDSIIYTNLAILADEMGETGVDENGNKIKGGGIGDFAFKDADTTDMSAWDKYMLDNYYSMMEGFEGRKLNRDVELFTDTADYPDQYYSEVMDSMYLPIDEAFNGNRPWDVKKFVYRYKWLDIEEAAKAKNKGKRRRDFIKTDTVEVYPDTTVWIRDFAYSYNEPMHNDYFWHDAYTTYPVVGVSWAQAKAFCDWRGLLKNATRKKGQSDVNGFRLPSEAEWEYAARGGLNGATYPWGNNYTKNDRGCFMANFKPLRGDYAADQALYTVEADTYEPNNFNLYNMAGNVSEWTGTSYEANAYEYMSTMNPSVSDKKNMRKVVRGGSWKDVAFFLHVSSRDYEYADSARSYVGFRTVQDYMGKDVTQTKNSLR